MKKLLTVVFSLVAFIGISVSSANAKTLKCQTVINAKADEVVMLKNFAKDVSDLTDGSLKFEIMPAGTVVGVKETLDAVDKGLIVVDLLGHTIGLVSTQQQCYLVRQ